ncbi:MAG: zinc ribbon domain-containing protein [Thermoplasmata archaeon]|nr:zinc ribbon domain-containing protein [Thermoplasmata archaeon]
MPHPSNEGREPRMAFSGSIIILIAVAAILAVVVIAIFLVVARRLRARRDQIVTELAGKPALVQDRAFNRLAMARREAEILARTGTDTSRALDLIAQSQGAFDTHQYPRAYELAQSAHEALVVARGRVARGPPTTSEVSLGRPPPSSTRSTSPVVASAPAPGLPRNRVESQFQLHLLEQELLNARTSHPTQGGTLEATKLQGEAQTAFDRADFTDAFRLALRARRSIGGKVEALAPQGRTARSTVAGGNPLDPVAAAERAASADRCPACGYPTLPDDTFCRGCGTPRVAATCSACGGPRSPGDTFCGRCGQPLTA